MKPKLSQSQIKALQDFSSIFGHGYGEYAYLSVRTAKSLEKKGLVLLGYYPRVNNSPMQWGWLTVTGLFVLAAIRAKTASGEAFAQEVRAIGSRHEPDTIARWKRERERLPGDPADVVAPFFLKV